ncbi:DNA-binding domain-containing protein [Tenacibaculum tangerinum]|uniref:DNA-binding domain-containing protein n=1 Tax=Tenacibaculum tangerinum TaxID=3038772 RepID=A0ABY8L5I0_9FLAO|nr:DNA-binding domain-containing protein [Tenacibaculum tangerinum]WGH76673.1 DNA-binding domain-containing protein [Tenacibaculum tangerinum]
MKYYLTENMLTEESNYSARILTERTINQEELIEKMLRKRNLVSKTDIVAVLNSFYEEIIESIEEGDNINLPIVNISYSITGVFQTEEDSLNPDIHKLHVNLNSGKLINEIKEDIPLQKITAPITSTVINNCKDITSQTTNTTITSNGLFELNGLRLKIEGDKEEIGLYFVAADGTETKVQYLAQNGYKKLIGQAPSLAAGAYKIRIKTQATYTAGVYLKEVRISESSFTVTAVS